MTTSLFSFFYTRVQGSGSNVDVCVITKDKLDYIRPHDEANKKGVRQRSYLFPHGTTEILTSSVRKYDVVETTVTATGNGVEAMET